jgi:hypothetical protein
MSREGWAFYNFKISLWCLLVNKELNNKRKTMTSAKIVTVNTANKQEPIPAKQKQKQKQ